MFKRTTVSTGVLLALGGALLTPQAAFAQETQRIEITGSAIKRTQAEGPAPVEIYTKKDIDRTGATSVAELVKSFSSLDIDDQGELTGNSPSGSGASNLQIRGLSERNVLILLNGRRLPLNALQDGSGAGAGVDVNTIPLSAIERVEILKDGGSAIYGADAVAGVINFITKRNYTGFEARIGYGISSEGDAKETPFGISGGFGNYDSAGFNIFGAFDYFKRDPLARTARLITASANWRARYPGGFDGRSTFHPAGNIITGAGSPGQLSPCPPEDLAPSGLCLFDFSKSVLTSINGADRWSAMLIGNVKLGSVGRLYGQYTRSESDDLFEAQPAPGAYADAQGRTIRARFMQPGPRTTNRISTLDHMVLGLDGTLRGIDYDFGVGRGVSKVTNNDKNYVATDLFTAAINNGTIDPTSTNNPESLVDAIRLTPKRAGKSVNKFIDGKISGPIMDLAGGPLQYAIGFQVVKESLSDQPDAQQQAGNVFGSIAQAAVEADRTAKGVFAELAIPLLKSLEGQVAVRHDRYPGESRTSPKVAVKWTPLSSFALRASYAESFLAPSLKQLFGGQDEGAESTDDPEICAAFPTLSGACVNFPYKERSGSNPNLKPETGKTYNVGLIFEPTNAVALGIDFWRITKKDEISTLSVSSAIENGDFGILNNEAVVFVTNQNVAATKNEGVDIDVRVRVGDTPLGRLTVRNSATYYSRISTAFEPGDPLFRYEGTFLYPRWRNTLSANLESGPWSTTATVRATAHMRDTDQPHGDFAATTRMIRGFDEVDVNVQYTGIKNLTLSGTIRNLFDRSPPYSIMGSQNQYGSLGFPWVYSPRGRFFSFAANYKFF